MTILAVDNSSLYTAKIVFVYTDFRKRFLSLLSFKFREFGCVMALSVLEAANTGMEAAKKLSVEDGEPTADLTARGVYYHSS